MLRRSCFNASRSWGRYKDNASQFRNCNDRTAKFRSSKSGKLEQKKTVILKRNSKKALTLVTISEETRMYSKIRIVLKHHKSLSMSRNRMNCMINKLLTMHSVLNINMLNIL